MQITSAGGLSRARPRTLFVSYNGLIEPLGSTQILPYVLGLADTFDVSVLSFEKAVRSPNDDAADTAVTERRLKAHGVEWVRLRYHKSPSLPATLYDVGAGILRILGAHRRRPFDMVHARGYVPAAIALGVKKRTGVPFLFDIRGLQAEEYLDAGHWAADSLAFRLTKHVEARVLRNADGLVTLTEAIRPTLRESPGLDQRPVLPPWRVIASCVDLDTFRFDAEGRQRIRARLGIGDRPVLVYAGSVGTWYMLAEMLDFFQSARERWRGLFFLGLVNRSPDVVADALRARGVPPSDFAITWARHDEMAAHLSAADAGIAFIRPSPSKRSSSPTKYAEYLACGLPFAATGGVGDVDELLTSTGAGVLLSEHSRGAYHAAADRLQELATAGNRSRWRAVAERNFSLATRALPAYRELYEQILRRRLRKRGLFLTPYPIHRAPSQRLKFEQYYADFDDHDIDVVVSSFVSPALWRVLYRSGHFVTKLVLGMTGHLRRLRDFYRARDFAFVYVHLWALPFGPPWFEELLARRGLRIIYDIDDLIYLPRASTANHLLRALRRRERIGRIMRVATHVIVCTEHLREFAIACNRNVTLISSTIDTDVYQPRQHSDARRSITIGWSGSHSTAPYLVALTPVLRLLSRRFNVRLLVIGADDFRIDGVNVEVRPWSLPRETSDLREMDIGVYPLPDEEWVLGKSGLKALQYMGVGVPVVASRIGAACQFIEDGVNGFLAEGTDEWVDKLSRLIVDPALRSEMGQAGRRTVEQRFSVRVTAPVYRSVIATATATAAEGDARCERTPRPARSMP
jgi:glycosyltransferase involved in cell wall biosynthesis